MADTDQQLQLNLPSLVVIFVISGLVIRYLFFSPSSGSGADSSSRSSQRSAAGRGTGTTSEAAQRAREAAAEQIRQMFPQVDRRTALWDLQRTGGNVGLTAERVLMGRLETPPITFQPPPPPGSTQAPTNTAAAKPTVRPVHADLITRYNLKGKLAPAAAASGAAENSSSSGAETGAGGKGARKGWSYDREERQSLLQKRRDQMILEARRKMEAKIAAEKAAKGAGA